MISNREDQSPQQLELMESDKAFVQASEGAGNCLLIITQFQQMGLRLLVGKDKYFRRNREVVLNSLESMSRHADTYLMRAKMPDAWLVRAVKQADAARSACQGCTVMDRGQILCPVLERLKPLREPLDEHPQFHEFLGNGFKQLLPGTQE